MASKLELIEEPGSYVILIYDKENIPAMKTFFPYLSQEKRQEARKKAEDFGQGMSQNLSLPLENLIN